MGLTELSWDDIESYQENPLFAGKTWKWSPVHWSLSESAEREIVELGRAAYSFYQALEKLYLKFCQKMLEYISLY